MAYETKFTFTAPTTNADGSVINTTTEPLTYQVLVDTVNPPIKAYSVPAAEVAAETAGAVTVTFKQLGFVPINGTTYYAEVVAISSGGTSEPTSVLAFTYTTPPSAPTGFTIS